MLRSNDGFAEFWPDYLRAHRKTGTRICHYVATLWGVSLGLYGIATLQIWYVIAAIVGGYALAVGSHYGFKDGKPLVGRSAVMGARADFRMIGLALTGRLDDEFRKSLHFTFARPELGSWCTVRRADLPWRSLRQAGRDPV